MTNYTVSSCVLVCPETKIPLRECSLHEASELIAGSSWLTWRQEGLPRAFGPTDRVLLRQDLACAYPIVNGIPVLLPPEMLFAERAHRRFDLKNTIWAEAYEEMEHYNSMYATETAQLSAGAASPFPPDLVEHVSTFPFPGHIWLDAAHDALGQLDCFLHLGNIRGRTVAQLGGKGLHAVKFLIAGAKEAWVISPMIGECLYAIALARRYSVEHKLRCVVAVGEQLPFSDDSLDAVFSGGCLHHMVVSRVATELNRVLAPGGKFCAYDPWKTFLHGLGTRILGKREEGVYCKPLNAERLRPLCETFKKIEIKQHGPIIRYLTIAACKVLKRQLPIQYGYPIGRFEDALFGQFRFFRKRGGSAAVLVTKEEHAGEIMQQTASPPLVLEPIS